ncbi:MAG: FtsX-like permease family protein [Desulfobacterales bacterium]|nr:FtsX-like permease family protein [Desulfobacterales bacterium]
MNRRAFFPLLLWAIRDNARRPGEACLLGITLAVLVALIATPLLLSAGLEATVDDALAMAPSLVVRRIGPGGWMPVPVHEATEAARKVPGVVAAWPRIWGIVPGPDGPLTIVAWTEATRENFRVAGLSKLPRQGEAVAGKALAEAIDNTTITLSTAPPATFRIAGRFPERTGLITHDMLLVHPDDARRMLALGADLASDLAVEVFYPSEQAAILPDLARAFPWPVRIVTRTEAAGRYAADLSRRGGIAMVALVPAVAALVLLVTATVREHLGKRVEIGLLKAMGWTTPDVAWFMGLRAAMVGLPAAALGAAAAYALVFWPGITWPVRLFFGWQQAPPGLYLNPTGAGTLMAAVIAMVLIPFFMAVLWPTLAAAAAPPGRFLEEKKSDA